MNITKLILLCAILPLAASTLGLAQWSQTSGPEGGALMSAITRGDTIIAISVEGRVQIFFDGAWHDAGSTGLGSVSGIVNVGETICAKGAVGIVRSTNGGRDWMESLPGWGTGSLVSDGNDVIVSKGDTLFRSRDEGVSWHPLLIGFPSGASTAFEGEHMFVSNGFSVVRYRLAPDDTAHAVLVDSLQPAMEGSVSFIGAIVLRNDTLYAGTIGAGVQRSTDLGVTWSAMNVGLPADQQPPVLSTLRFEGDELWGSDQNGELYRFRMGEWRNTPLGEYAYGYVNAFTGIIALTQTEPRVLDQFTSTWSAIGTGMKGVSTGEMIAIPNGLIVSGPSTLFRTTDAGGSWETIAPFSASRFAAGNGVLYALTAGGYHTYGRVVRSFDNGTTWQTIDSLLPEPLSAGAAIDVKADGNDVFVALSESFSFHGNSRWVNGGVLRSTDRGTSWREINAGLANDGFTYVPVTSFALTDGGMLATTAVGIYRSDSRNGGWSSIGSNGLPASATGYVQAWLPGNYRGMTFAQSSYGLYTTSDKGTSWKLLAQCDSAAGENFAAVSVVGDSLYALIDVWDGRLNRYRLVVIGGEGISTDITDQVPAGTVLTKFAAADGYIFAGSHGESVWRNPLPPASTDVGAGAHPSPRMAIAPNPSTSNGVLRFELASAAVVRLSIVDQLGHSVVDRPATTIPSGPQEILLDGSHLPSGIYVVRITIDARTHSMTWIRM